MHLCGLHHFPVVAAIVVVVHHHHRLQVGAVGEGAVADFKVHPQVVAVYLVVVGVADEHQAAQLRAVFERTRGDDAQVGVTGEQVHQVHGHASAREQVVPAPPAAQRLVEARRVGVVAHEGRHVVLRALTVLHIEVAVVFQEPPLLPAILVGDVELVVLTAQVAEAHAVFDGEVLLRHAGHRRSDVDADVASDVAYLMAAVAQPRVAQPGVVGDARGPVVEGHVVGGGECHPRAALPVGHAVEIQVGLALHLIAATLGHADLRHHGLALALREALLHGQRIVAAVESHRRPPSLAVVGAAVGAGNALIEAYHAVGDSDVDIRPSHHAGAVVAGEIAVEKALVDAQPSGGHRAHQSAIGGIVGLRAVGPELHVGLAVVELRRPGARHRRHHAGGVHAARGDLARGAQVQDGGAADPEERGAAVGAVVYVERERVTVAVERAGKRGLLGAHRSAVSIYVASHAQHLAVEVIARSHRTAERALVLVGLQQEGVARGATSVECPCLQTAEHQQQQRNNKKLFHYMQYMICLNSCKTEDVRSIFIHAASKWRKYSHFSDKHHSAHLCKNSHFRLNSQKIFWKNYLYG